MRAGAYECGDSRMDPRRENCVSAMRCSANWGCVLRRCNRPDALVRPPLTFWRAVLSLSLAGSRATAPPQLCSLANYSG